MNDPSLTIDRDALKLLVRNALAQKAVRTSAGLLIIKLAAVNKMCLDAIVRVTNQFGNALLTTDRIALSRDRWTLIRTVVRDEKSPAIVITRSHFVWMVQWGMLRLQSLTIASKNMSGWHSLIELFRMPSLKELRWTRSPSRDHTDTSSLVLAADIIKLNASNIQELDRVPVWKLPEPLPPLRLKHVVYEPRPRGQRLDNLSRCTVDVLAVFTDHLRRFTLDVLDDVDAKEIRFYPFWVGANHFRATGGATNERVRRISVCQGSIDVREVQLLHRFFPQLTEMEIDVSLCGENLEETMPDLLKLSEIGQYFESVPAMPVLCGHVVLQIMEEQIETHDWTAEDVSDQYGKLHEMRKALELVPPQLTVSLWPSAAFRRADESQTKEADKLANQLGFSRRGNGEEYEIRSELAPGRDLWMRWEVSA